MNSGNACYHSVQKLLSSRQMFKNIKIRIYRTIILAFFLYGCETWSLTLSEEHGRAIAQAVSRRLPTAAARVQTRVWSYGIL
jgi:hypothetical protein